MKRIYSIDICRGLAMIIMALDHTRDFLHVNAFQNPTDLATTTPALFFTRWITHLCAPSFVFLSGVSAWLSSRNHPDPRGNRLFLCKRGIWLIILDLTIVNFALWTDIRFRMWFFEVLGAIGFGFIVLSLLYKLSPRILGMIGLVIIFGHDLLSSVVLPPNPFLQFTGSFLMRRGAFQISPHFLFFVGYPVLPWLGIMLLGFACGPLFEYSVDIRKKIFLRTGLVSLGLFILLRYSNIYGDPFPWSTQKNAIFSFLSFMDVSKYPPSLLYTLLTLGILFLGLYLSEGRNNRYTGFISTYGKTPLFYFLIHLYLIHLIMFIVVFAQGFHPQDLVFGPFRSGRPAKGSGIGLPAVYLVWLGVVALMYPLSRKYGIYKTGHPKNKWLRYL